MIVIYCPGECHKQPKHNKKTGKDEVKTKILCTVDKNTAGLIRVQCNDSQCKRSGDNRGWYQIDINGTGGITTSPVPRHRFDLEALPTIGMG